MDKRKRKKIVIIGAGPAGLFAAYKLAGKVDVDLIDKGRNIEQRKCSVGSKARCTKCKPCNVIYGVGGAGLFSDGKLMFDTNIGNNLGYVIPKKKNINLVTEVEKIFLGYGVKVQEGDPQKINLLKKKASQHGIDSSYARQAHIGSDNLSNLMRKMRNDLKEKGVGFFCDQEIKTLSEINYDIVVLAPGRGGSIWLEQILHDNLISYSYRPVDIGVRVEVPKEITEDVVKVARDMKFYVVTEKHRDLVRTFCTCVGGRVDIEAHDKFVLINGHSDAQKETGNTNFALLVTIPLTKPLVNTNILADLIAQLFSGLGDGKPILQRFGDLKRGKRSKIENQNRYRLKPTLKDVTYGDIALAMPARYLNNIVEAIEKLNKIMPGLANDSTILYAPEIKFHGLNIKTDRYLRAAPKIYVAGDGAGVSRGIVGAAASGLLVALGVLRNID